MALGGSLTPVALVVLLAALLVLSPQALAGPGAASSPGPRALAHGVPGFGLSTTGLPASLQASAAARMGYSPEYLAEVPDPTPAVGNVTVALTFWPADSGLFSAARSNHMVSAGQLATQYGLSAGQYTAVAGYLAEHGLTVGAAPSDRLALTATGPAGAVGSAFGVRLLTGQFEGSAVRFPDRPPELPAAWGPEVAAISGLSDGFTHFVPESQRIALPPTASPLRTAQYVSPTAPHVIYGLNDLYNYSGSPHWATGVGIALILWGDGYNPTDLQWFFQNNYPTGFPLPTVRDYPVNGAPAPSAQAVFDPSGAPQELTLDLEWAGSQAPGATLDAVYAPDGPASNGYSPTDTDLEAAVREAVTQISGVQVLSMSFSTPDGSDPTFQAAMDVLLAEAAQRGISVVAASGDDGGTSAADCGGSPSPQYPAASPYALAVGGTAPVLAQNTLGQLTGLASEPAWNRSGGGYAPDYPAPGWQVNGVASAPIVAHGSQRGIPDVAGPAAANLFYYNSSPAAGQGTSFATPMWAGLVAEMDALRGAPLGELSPRLYAVATAQAGGSAAPGLADITQGGNCVTSATAGWDAATGLGTPRALALYDDLSGTFVNLTTSISPQPVAPGGVLRVAATVLNATSGRPIGGLTVNFALSAIGVSGPCGSGLPTGAAITGADGNASVTLTVPACYFGSKIGVTVTLLSGGYFGNSATTVPVNLLGLGGFLAGIQQYPYNLVAFVAIMGAAVGIAYLLGRRRTAGTRRSRAPAALTARARPAGVAAPPGPSQAPRPPPDGPGPASPAPVAAPSGVPPPSVVVPAHVIAPPQGPTECPVCHTLVAPELANCPTCGRGTAPADGPG